MRAFHAAAAVCKYYGVERKEERKWPGTKRASRRLVAASVFRVRGGVTKSLRAK